MHHGLDISKLLHQGWIDGRSAALAMVRPWRLAQAARQSSLVGAIVAALLALAVECSAILVVVIARFELDPEPVATRLFDAVIRFRHALPLVLAALSAAMVPVLVGLVLLTRRATTAVLNVFVLTPACFVLAALGWAVAALVLDASPTGRSAMTPCIWMPLGVIAAVGLQVHALTALDARAPVRPRECPRCGYSLRGLRPARCPECGWRPRDR